jgi:hypothetical protein
VHPVLPLDQTYTPYAVENTGKCLLFLRGKKLVVLLPFFLIKSHDDNDDNDVTCKLVGAQIILMNVKLQITPCIFF